MRSTRLSYRAVKVANKGVFLKIATEFSFFTKFKKGSPTSSARGIFHPLSPDVYKPDIHINAKTLRTETELSFCQPLTLPDDSGGRHMPRWGNIVHHLLAQQTPKSVEDFYVSSLSSLEGRFKKSSQLQIHYFHQDPEIDPCDAEIRGAWKKAILKFTAVAEKKAECVQSQYTGSSVLVAGRGTLAGYIALPTKVFANHWPRFYSNDLGSALSVLLYGPELQPYGPSNRKGPFDCTAGSMDISIRISNPTVRKMKIALGLTEEIGSFFSGYKSVLEEALQEIQEVNKIQRDLVLSELHGNGPLFQAILKRETGAIIQEKIKKPGETLRALHPQFPKSILTYSN